MTQEAPLVSVIVCAYTQRRWGDLQDSVNSVLLQSEPAEVIVVIDHEPELLRMAQERWPSLTVIPNTGPQGLSGGRNTGIEAATADIVAFLGSLSGEIPADARVDAPAEATEGGDGEPGAEGSAVGE